MKVTKEFAPADRYLYDFGLCSYANGFCQVDTQQDASYFGTWINPTRLILFTYCEGDTTLTECANAAEFIDAVRELATWNKDQGYWIGIDAGLPEQHASIREALVSLGLEDLTH